MFLYSVVWIFSYFNQHCFCLFYSCIVSNEKSFPYSKVRKRFCPFNTITIPNETCLIFFVYPLKMLQYTTFQNILLRFGGFLSVRWTFCVRYKTVWKLFMILLRHIFILININSRLYAPVKSKIWILNF